MSISTSSPGLRMLGMLGAISWIGGSLALRADDRSYDPLAIARPGQPEIVDLVVEDTDRRREIPLRVYLPAVKTPAPVVLFSHGLGGSRKNNPYLGEHWSGRGFVVVYMQHHGSDEHVWKDGPLLQRIAALKQAANVQNALLRFKDVPAVIDQLERWNTSKDSQLMGRMNLEQLGMSGHSFGALTTQGVSGQSVPLSGAIYTDPRIKAALPMSPSGGNDPQRAFAGVKIPWLLMTGTEDESPIGNTDVESRLAVYPALPSGQKYELVLHQGKHEAFSDHPLPFRGTKRNPNHHRIILATSTAFWDAYLKGDARARAWLDGTGPASVLEPQDRWQHK